MEHLNELIIENIIDNLDFDGFRNYYEASNKSTKEIIRGLMSYDIILKKIISKIIRECFESYPSIDLLAELDRWVHFEEMGFDTNIYDRLLSEKSKNFQSKLDLNHPMDKMVYKELSTPDGLILLSEQNNIYGKHAKVLLDLIEQEMDKWNHNLRNYLMKQATPDQVFIFAKGLSKYLKSFGKYQSNAMQLYLDCLQPKLKFLTQRLGISSSLLNQII
jgi:hypothetical protein